GFQSILLNDESLRTSWKPPLAMLTTLLIGLFIASRIFRWEKEEKIKASAKASVAAVLLPFLVLGAVQLRSRETAEKENALWRDLERSETFLIRNVKVFVGDGKVIESGGVLVKDGKIAEV